MTNYTWRDILTLTIKLVLLLLWFIPLYFFFITKVPSLLDIELFTTPFFISILSMILVISVTTITAISVTFALSPSTRLMGTGSKDTGIFAKLGIGLCALGWLLPTTLLNPLFISLSDSIFLDTKYRLWLRLFPMMVITISLLIHTINQRLFMLSQYGQVPGWQLVYRYFLPTLTPGIWLIMALTAAFTPNVYFSLSEVQLTAHQQTLINIIFVIPLLFMARHILRLTPKERKQP